LELRGDEAVAVLEMGMNMPVKSPHDGDRTPRLCRYHQRWAAHLAGVGGTIAGVAAAKGELVTGLTANASPRVNTDDEWVQRIAAPFTEPQSNLRSTGEVRAEHLRDFGADGWFDLLIDGRRRTRTLSLCWSAQRGNALAAAALDTQWKSH